MADFEELSFVIPGYTPDTMPLDVLIEYLKEVSIVVGNPEDLHLVGIQKSSTAPVFHVAKPAAERAREQAARVGRGEGTKAQTAAFNRLRRFVRRDSRDAARRPALLRSADRILLEIPAAPEDSGILIGIRQASQVDGKLIRIGGDGENASLQMTDLQDRLLTGFTVKHHMVKEMAKLIYEPIRVTGIGIWGRDEEGVWNLSKMEVQSYEALDDETLETMLDRLRQLKVDWPRDALNMMLADRDAAL